MADYAVEPLQSAQIFYGDASGSATTELTNITGIMVPDAIARVIPANTLASTRDTFVVSSVRGTGELVFNYQYAVAQYNTVEGLKATAKYWSIGLPDTTGTIIFPGVLLENAIDMTGGPEALGDVSAKVQVTGAATITVGS